MLEGDKYVIANEEVADIVRTWAQLRAAIRSQHMVPKDIARLDVTLTSFLLDRVNGSKTALQELLQHLERKGFRGLQGAVKQNVVPSKAAVTVAARPSEDVVASRSLQVWGPVPSSTAPPKATDSYCYTVTVGSVGVERACLAAQQEAVRSKTHGGGVPPHVHLLTYAILGLGSGHFWGLTPEAYKEVRRRYGQRALECFASPYNHNLDRFYSLFPELDAPYGSVGSFFQNFPDDDRHDAYVINPPFTQDLMLRTFGMVAEKAPTSSALFVIYVTNWTDITRPFLVCGNTAGGRLTSVSQEGHNKQPDKYLPQYKQLVGSYVSHRLLPAGASAVYDYVAKRRFPADFEGIFIAVAPASRAEEAERLLDALAKHMKASR